MNLSFYFVKEITVITFVMVKPGLTIAEPDLPKLILFFVTMEQDFTKTNLIYVDYILRKIINQSKSGKKVVTVSFRLIRHNTCGSSGSVCTDPSH